VFSRNYCVGYQTRIESAIKRENFEECFSVLNNLPRPIFNRTDRSQKERDDYLVTKAEGAMALLIMVRDKLQELRDYEELGEFEDISDKIKAYNKIPEDIPI